MVWTKDIGTGEIRFLTQNFSSVFEIPMEELEADPGLLKKQIHPDDLPFIDVFSKNLLSYQNEQIEYRIVTPAGNEKWLQERKRLVKNELGEIIRLDVLLLEVTQQKREERILMESEGAYKGLFYSLNQPMWVYETTSLCFLAVNEAAVSFYGYTHDEFFRMTIKQIRPKEDVPKLLHAIENQSFPEKDERVWRHLKKDGTLVYVRIVSSPIQFRGKNARWVMVNEVTNQVEAENQRKIAFQSLENFKQAISKNSLLAQINSKMELEFINEEFQNRNGLSENEWKGQHFSRLFSPIYRKNQLDDIAQNLRDGKLWMGERKFVGKRGQFFWVRCSIFPLVDDPGMPNQYILLADDITSLKEAEKKAKEYAIRLHNIIEGITDAIFVLDRRWHITDLNQAAEILFGKKRSQLLNQNVWELLPEEEGFRFYQFFRKAKRRKMTVEFEEYFQPKDQWYDISLYPSADGLAVCFRDVTDRRKKEEERKELMEQLVIQNRDLEEFTYIASHNLRAQIANISMLCSAMDISGLTPSNQEVFDRLFQSSSNLDTIISDLNTILTIKDRSAVLMEMVSVHNCYINILARLPQNLASFKKFVHLEAPEGLKFFTVRTYLETLILQLIINSLRFRSMDRDPEVLISVEDFPQAIQVTIHDNGRGFDAQKVKKQIFQLYKTFHPGLSGKGLGLYLSKILVDELRGKINLESTPGSGTIIQIRLPKQED